MKQQGIPRLTNLCLPVAILSIVSLLSGQQQMCPPCNGTPTFKPLPRNHGADPANRKAYVWYYFDAPTFGSNVTLMQNATNQAVGAWNSKPICYELIPMPQNANQPDIYIQNTTNYGTPCAANNAMAGNTYPHVISLNSEDLSSRTVSEVAATIEHELSHSFGLVNASSSCDPTMKGVTIMTGFTDTCKQVDQTIQQVDVDQSNAFCNKNGNCPSSTDTKDDSWYPACPSGPSCGAYLNPDYCTYGNANSGCPIGASIIAGSRGPGLLFDAYPDCARCSWGRI